MREAAPANDARREIAMPLIAPLQESTSAPEVEALCPPDEDILVCDFYVTDAEHGELVPGGLRLGRILNVDHHAEIPEMERPITSTMLAAEYLASGGAADPASCVVIHHTDCDSMLSSAMLLGIVPPDPDLVHASVCADHTGDPDPVADLLQALDDGRHGTRTREQYLASVRNLQALRAGGTLDDDARAALERREERRRAAQNLVDAGRFVVDEHRLLAFAIADGSIDSAFFPPLLRDAGIDAAVIMVAHLRDDGHWTVKLRLGDNAPQGLTLHSLSMKEIDLHYGGRWNAGSNGRGGGTRIPPRVYADLLRARLVQLTSTT